MRVETEPHLSRFSPSQISKTIPVTQEACLAWRAGEAVMAEGGNHGAARMGTGPALRRFSLPAIRHVETASRTLLRADGGNSIGTNQSARYR